MHRIVVTQLLKHGAAIVSRKERDSTSNSGTFEVHLCLGLFAMSRSYVSAGVPAAGRGSGQERQLVEGGQS